MTGANLSWFPGEREPVPYGWIQDRSVSVETGAVLRWSSLPSGCFTNLWQHCTGNTINQEVKEMMQNVISVTFIIVT